MDAEQTRQRQWHDSYYRKRGRENTLSGGAAQDKYYSITGRAFNHFHDLTYARCAGRQVLDYCCGTGLEAIRMARAGAKMTGIDISPVAIDIARDTARDEGLSDEHITFLAMAAERTAFQNDSFDIVYGQGALHHLHLAAAAREVARVLRPDGRAVFSEPLAYNPVCNAYRGLTSGARTEGEHRLSRADYNLLSQYFGRVSYQFTSLTAFAAVPFRRAPFFPHLLHALDTLDGLLFRIPGVKWLAWRCIVTLGEPMKSSETVEMPA